MDYPYYKCTKCGQEIAEMSFPIHPRQKYPNCSNCKTNENVDIAIGDKNTVLDSEMVVFSDNVEGAAHKQTKGSGDNS